MMCQKKDKSDGHPLMLMMMMVHISEKLKRVIDRRP